MLKTICNDNGWNKSTSKRISLKKARLRERAATMMILTLPLAVSRQLLLDLPPRHRLSRSPPPAPANPAPSPELLKLVPPSPPPPPPPKAPADSAPTDNSTSMGKVRSLSILYFWACSNQFILSTYRDVAGLVRNSESVKVPLTVQAG